MWKQCDLVRGTNRQTAWIPVEHAKRGKVLRLRDEDGYRVLAVYGPAVGGEVLTFLKDWKQFASTTQ